MAIHPFTSARQGSSTEARLRRAGAWTTKARQAQSQVPPGQKHGAPADAGPAPHAALANHGNLAFICTPQFSLAETKWRTHQSDSDVVGHCAQWMRGSNSSRLFPKGPAEDDGPLVGMCTRWAPYHMDLRGVAEAVEAWSGSCRSPLGARGAWNLPISGNNVQADTCFW